MIPTSIYTSVLRTIEGFLRHDPILSREVRTWKSWTGDKEDANDPPSTYGQGFTAQAAIELSADMGPGEWFEEGRVLAEMMLVRIRTWTWDGKLDTNMDLWRAIVEAIYPTDPDRFAANMEAWDALETDTTSVLPPLPVKPTISYPKPGETSFTTEGIITIQINTQLGA